MVTTTDKSLNALKLTSISCFISDVGDKYNAFVGFDIVNEQTLSLDSFMGGSINHANYC